MRIIDIPGGQGSQAWLQHRRDHFNASDAPAMMDCSPYKTRNELVRELATGITPEVSPEMQRRFDKGHRFERLARPLAEAIVGDQLSPIVVTEGRFSASLDGATFMGDVNMEHKQLNTDLRVRIKVSGGSANECLPLLYRVQMEHQHLCSTAERTLFIATEWDDNDQLVEERHCWYTPDLALRQQIVAAWAQLEADVAAYVPAEPAAVVVAAATPNLPAVVVRLDGALTVAGNLPAFGVALRAFIDRMPVNPTTDQEFADTDAACKALKKAEDALDAAESSALASIGDVEAMRRLVADFKTLARITRLASTKLVTARKQQIREDGVARGRRAVVVHVAELNKRLGGPYVNDLTRGDFAGAIKGLSSLDSLNNAIDTEIAATKIEADGIAARVEQNLKTLADAGADVQALFADKRTLALKDPEAVAAIVAQRVAEHKAAEERKLEAERQRIRAEEEARATARADAEQRQKQALEAAQARAATAPEPPAPIAQNAPQQTQPAGAAITPGVAAEAAASIADEKPSIKLGELAAWAGAGGAPLNLTRAFIEGLGIHPTIERNAVLFTATQKRALKAALVKHFEGLSA